MKAMMIFLGRIAGNILMLAHQDWRFQMLRRYCWCQSYEHCLRVSHIVADANERRLYSQASRYHMHLLLKRQFQILRNMLQWLSNSVLSWVHPGKFCIFITLICCCCCLRRALFGLIVSTERLTHTLSGEPAAVTCWQSGLVPFFFKQEATKSRGGGEWKGSAKIILEKEKAGVYAVCEEIIETSLWMVWLLHGLSKPGEVLNNHSKVYLKLN